MGNLEVNILNRHEFKILYENILEKKYERSNIHYINKIISKYKS